ncbi:malonyl-CoA-acyl carrier protein transacylase, mitochondrial-like isoform X2 [Amphiura filiformis]
MASVSVLMSQNSIIHTNNLIKMGVLGTSRLLQRTIPCFCCKMSHQNPVLRYSVYYKQAISKPSKQWMISRFEWPKLERNKPLGISLPSAASANCFHTSSIQGNREEDTDELKRKEPSGRNDVTEVFSNVDGQRLLNEQKERYKTMLDDAQSSPRAVPDSFDFSDVPQHREEPIEERPKKAKLDPTDMSVLLFPGQGSQFVGMGEQLLDYPVVKDMYEAASAILGYDLLALCLNGPKEDLDRTVHCQPAVLVTSLAAVEKLKHENIKALENCVAAAGFSVGEYAALVFGDVLSFEDAIYLIKIRAEAMQRASDMVPSGMISVIGGRATKYKEICAEATSYCKVSLKMEKPVCKVANYLFPNARVLAGNNEALDFIIDMRDKFHLRKIKRLPVSGAFHTPLMAPAEDAIAAALEKIDMEKPPIKIHSNVDSKAYVHEKHIRKQLCRQVVEPVLWEQTMKEIYQRDKGENFPQTYEVGPGKQLGAMLQRFNGRAFRSYFKVEV